MILCASLRRDSSSAGLTSPAAFGAALLCLR